MDTIDPLARSAPHIPKRPDPADPLWQQAVKLEALLFSQMLEAAGAGGLGAPGETDGPQRQFDSFLRQAQAEAVASSGTTGLAQILYRDLKGRDAA